MKSVNKIISLLLTVCMLLSMMIPKANIVYAEGDEFGGVTRITS